MKYDGVVAKIFDDNEDKIFLFFLDPETGKMRDGLDIQDNMEIYKNLSYNTLMVVEVLLKDGTVEVDIDLDDFIDGQYGKYDIFIHIKDLLPYKLAHKNDEGKVVDRSVDQVIQAGEFPDVALECIELTKEELSNREKQKEENV